MKKFATLLRSTATRLEKSNVKGAIKDYYKYVSSDAHTTVNETYDSIHGAIICGSAAASGITTLVLTANSDYTLPASLFATAVATGAGFTIGAFHWIAIPIIGATLAVAGVWKLLNERYKRSQHKLYGGGTLYEDWRRYH